MINSRQVSWGDSVPLLTTIRSSRAVPGITPICKGLLLKATLNQIPNHRPPKPTINWDFGEPTATTKP